MVFSGRSHPTLAGRIAEQLGVELGTIQLDTFKRRDVLPLRRVDSRRRPVPRPDWLRPGRPEPDGAAADDPGREARLGEAHHRRHPDLPLRAAGRKAKPREPISARLVADMLQLAGADRVLAIDIHAGQSQGFFTIPVDHMTALPLFARHFRDLGLTGEGVVSVAPDAGRAKVAVRFAEMIDADFALMHKTRPGARRGRRDGDHRPGARQARDPRRRRDHDGRHPSRERPRAQGARGGGRVGVRDARPVLRQRAGAVRRTPTSAASSSPTRSRSIRSPARTG